MDLFLHRQAELATATGFRLKPRKPFHPHGLKPSGFTGSSVKDILAHITWWEQSCFGWLGLPPAAQRSAIPQGLDGDDAINAAIFEGNRDRALDEVLASFERSFEALVRGVEAASEEQIDAPRASDPGGTPLWELFPATATSTTASTRSRSARGRRRYSGCAFAAQARWWATPVR